MEVAVKPRTTPVMDKARRDTPKECGFLSKYVSKLQAYGFIEPIPHTSWESAPLLVPTRHQKRWISKPLPANYRLTFE